MINTLKKSIIHEVVGCEDADLLDLVYKLLLTEKKDTPTKWADVEMCEGYEVSTNGEVRNKKSGKLLKYGINHKGYRQVTMRKKTISTKPRKQNPSEPHKRR